MYGLTDLKPRISVGRDLVECPVKGCITHVPRQPRQFQTTREYRCPYHGIFISPCTFEYEDVRRNLPLLAEDDWELLERRVGDDVRAEHHLARERSEDAVVVNVFRGLERRGGIGPLAEAITGRPQASTDVGYWPRLLDDGSVLPTLLEAQKAIEGRPTRGSRPDLVIQTPTEVLFVVPKVTRGNNTTQSNPKVLAKLASRQGWYDRVFAKDAETVAVKRRKAELMRLWLVGTWMANRAGKRFTLVALTRAARDRKLEHEFSRLIRPGDNREFVRLTWESVAELTADTEATRSVSEYLLGKSLGYDSRGRVRAMCRPPADGS